MSWSTSALLAIVMWLDGGLRRIPSESILLRRSLAGRWRIIEIVRAHRWRAIGHWPAVIICLVATEPEQTSVSPQRLRERLQRVRTPVWFLRTIGALSSVSLVFGAPIAVARYGRTGLYYSAAILLVIGLATALLSMIALRRLEVGRRTCVRFGITHLWPFAGPYAAERVLNLAIVGSSPVEVTRFLAGSTTFANWARPFAYDALAAQPSGKLLLLDGFDFRITRDNASEMVQGLPPNASPGDKFCPRCGASYRRDVSECTDCLEVSLSSSTAGAVSMAKPITARRQKRNRRR